MSALSAASRSAASVLACRDANRGQVQECLFRGGGLYPPAARAACYQTDERSRLIYAIREYNGRKDQPKGFGWRDFRDLILRARSQLGGPIVLV
ncbi:hypothetical protein AB0H34_45320 [Saccharopolyspora shandongensis]|uniref:hypothetical protein n=1 Tax=Saccharopolyspora shandongensis TaxID=418495 RepID=UPI0033E33479